MHKHIPAVGWSGTARDPNNAIMRAIWRCCNSDDDEHNDEHNDKHNDEHNDDDANANHVT